LLNDCTVEILLQLCAVAHYNDRQPCSSLYHQKLTVLFNGRNSFY